MMDKKKPGKPGPFELLVYVWRCNWRFIKDGQGGYFISLFTFRTKASDTLARLAISAMVN